MQLFGKQWYTCSQPDVELPMSPRSRSQCAQRDVSMISYIDITCSSTDNQFCRKLYYLHIENIKFSDKLFGLGSST